MRRIAAAQRPPASWSMPKKLIGIAALPRSGSNYLGDLMKQTDLLGRPNEFFNPHVLKQQFPGRGNTLADSCLLARELGTSSNDVVGIKFFSTHFPSVENGLRINEWFGEPVWVWLRRRDMLGQVISFLIAAQTGAFTSEQTVEVSPRYSSLRISEALHKFSLYDARWRAYFNRTQITPLEIEYEDLEQDPERMVRMIADAAGVEIDVTQATPRSTYQKQRTALNEEWRERFLETMGDPDVFFPPRRKIRGALGSLIARIREPK